MNLGKKIHIGLILIIFISISSCSNFTQKEKNRSKANLTFADSTWLKFAQAIESKNIDYLIQNSLDTIQCAECKLGIENKTELYESKFVFSYHLEQVKHLESLTDYEYSTFQNNNLIKINYKIKSKNAEEGGYNLIFTFIKTENGYKFKGMIIT